MIGKGVKDDSRYDNPDSNYWYSDSENDENTDSEDNESENDDENSESEDNESENDDENTDSEDNESENEDEKHYWWPDWWRDTDPLDIFIEDDGTIVRRIEGDITYLKNGAIESNGKIYKSEGGSRW